MGCTPYLKTNKGLSQNKKLVILPGTFVKINQNEFRQVYKLGKTLGTGSYAEVRLCMNKQTRSNRAVKIITKESLSEIGKFNLLKKLKF
jgi:Protein kinase domain.